MNTTIYNLVQSTISTTAHLSINKELIRKIGLNSAVFLSDLITKHKYFINENMCEIDGWFFNTEKNRQEDTGLTHHQQQICIKKLTELNLLQTMRKGIPSKTYFKINYPEIIEILKYPMGCQDIKKGLTRQLKQADLTLKTGPLYNKNKIIRISNKNKEKKNKEKNSSPFSESLQLLPSHLRRNQKFVGTWRNWFEYRQEIKKKLTPISIKRQINMLTKYSSEQASEIIDQSIMNGWRGLFPPKQNQTPKNKSVNNGNEWRDAITKRSQDEEIIDI